MGDHPIDFRAVVHIVELVKSRILTPGWVT